MAFGSDSFVTIVAIWGTLQSRLRRTESAPLTLLSLKFVLATILCLCLVHTQHINYNTGFTAASISVLHPSHVARCLALWSYCTVIILYCGSYCTVIILHCTFYAYHMPGHFDGTLNYICLDILSENVRCPTIILFPCYLLNGSRMCTLCGHLLVSNLISCHSVNIACLLLLLLVPPYPSIDNSVPLRTGTCYIRDFLCCFCKIIVLCKNY